MSRRIAVRRSTRQLSPLREPKHRFGHEKEITIDEPARPTEPQLNQVEPEAKDLRAQRRQAQKTVQPKEREEQEQEDEE